MSQVTLQEARSLSEQLSAAEKIQLIEWLSVQLRQELDAPRHTAEVGAPAGNDKFANGHGSSELHVAEPVMPNLSIDEASPTWTDEEIQAMMRSTPKTGAEIVALLQKLDLRSWEEQEIPDVVEWLANQRAQSRHLRQAQWDTIDS